MSSLIRGSYSFNKTTSSKGSAKAGRTVRPRRNNLKFGVDPNKLCIDGDLHPGLHELLRHIYLNGPTGPTFPVLRRASRSQSKILKKYLQQGQLRRISKYSPSACLLCFRNFLKHSPKSPLLQGEEFLRLADDINMLPSSQRSWLVNHCQRILNSMRPVDNLLLKYLIGVMRCLCFLNGDTLYQNKLDELISLFGPVILRQKQSSFTRFSKPVCPEAVVITRFLIIHAVEVFGPEIDQLYQTPTESSELTKAPQECILDEEIIAPPQECILDDEIVSPPQACILEETIIPPLECILDDEIIEPLKSEESIKQESTQDLLEDLETPETELTSTPEDIYPESLDETVIEEDEDFTPSEIQEKEETESSISQQTEEQTGLVKFDPNLIEHITEINRTVSDCQNLLESDENT